MSQAGIKIEKRATKGTGFSFDVVKKDKTPTVPATPTPLPQAKAPDQIPQNPINVKKPIITNPIAPVHTTKPLHVNPLIEKPVSTRKKKLVFQFPNKEKLYTKEEAEEFRKKVKEYLDTTETKKISDEQFIQMNSLLSRFKFSQIKNADDKIGSGRPGRSGQSGQSTILSRSDSEKQDHKITSELNKLTIDNFMTIIDNLTVYESNFLNKTYLEMLATNLVQQATLQPLFSSLYSLSAVSISQVLNNKEYTTARTTFTHTINIKAREAVEAVLDSTNKFASDAAIGSASFFGFLSNREFVPIDETHNLVMKLIKNPSPSNIEICRQLLIPAGEQLESRFPSTSIEVFGKLTEISKDKKVPGSIRYPLIDLLEARKNNWNTKSLMHEIVSAKTSHAQSNLTQVSSKKNQEREPEQKTKNLGNNSFAYLLNSDNEDDEEFHEEEEEEALEFNGNDMVRQYVIDNEVASNWQKSQIFGLLFAIALRPEKEISKAMRLLQEINDNNDFPSPEETFKAISLTAEKCYSDEIYDDNPNAIINCGSIFGRLVYFNSVTVDQFCVVFPTENYNLDVTIAFLKEIIRVKKIDLLRESQIWSQYKWRPNDCSHLDIILEMSKIPNSGSIFELFPLYDYLFILYDTIDFIQNPEENDEVPDLKMEIETFPPDITTMPAFAIGAIEILIKYYVPTYFDIVLPLLVDNQLLVLQWVEKYGVRELRDMEKIATLIQMVANYGKYNLNDFINSNGDEKHNELVQSLK